MHPSLHPFPPPPPPRPPPRSLYMLMELVQGGEFFTYLQAREAPLSEGEARFYAGCVILALEYMHDRGVAWR